MGAYARALADRGVDPAGRRWLFVPYDQLTDAVGPLSREDPDALGIVVVETTWKPRQRPYHKQKLATVLAGLRAFALEQAERGVAVEPVFGEASYGRLLAPVTRRLGPLRMMRAAERELRADLAPLVEAGAIEELPHEGWLTTADQFTAVCPSPLPEGKRWRMDAFYRHVRRETGILMDGDAPVGGRFSFDTENRRPWKGEPPAPTPPSFPVDAIKQEVGALVERRFGGHPGALDLASLATTAADAEAAWRFALDECLADFGPFEDAMSRASDTLFHTRISALLNVHRLLPARVVADVAALDAPIASREGFVRQVLGWREFVHHVHEETDGLRRLPHAPAPDVAPRPGDAGIGRWRGAAWSPPPGPGADAADGGARPSALGADSPLPPAFWGEASGLACLDHVVESVWRTAYGHHITRLMVLSNIATLLDVSPRELTDWFWVAYTDAYDWVVEPNVLGMGTFGLGDLFVTKPYVSGAAYVHRMSDFCGECAFDPKRTCPLTALYWGFLERHAERLRDNPRMALPLRSLEKRSREQRRHDRRIVAWARETLSRGDRLRPGDRPEADR